MERAIIITLSSHCTAAIKIKMAYYEYSSHVCVSLHMRMCVRMCTGVGGRALTVQAGTDGYVIKLDVGFVQSNHSIQNKSVLCYFYLCMQFCNCQITLPVTFSKFYNFSQRK